MSICWLILWRKYYFKCQWSSFILVQDNSEDLLSQSIVVVRDNPVCCLFEIRVRKHQLFNKTKQNPTNKMLFFSMSFIMWENGKKHLELSMNSKVQPENSSIGSLHPLSHYLSSFVPFFNWIIYYFLLDCCYSLLH